MRWRWSWPNANGTDQWEALAPGWDTSPAPLRDDDPQSGGSAGRIYDYDVPGVIATGNHADGYTFRLRWNFRAVALYNTTRCSEYLPWFTRQSYRKLGPSDTGTGTCPGAHSLTDEAKEWDGDAWAPGVVRVEWPTNEYATWVTGNDSDTLYVDPEWPSWTQYLWDEVPYKVIVGPSDTPTWVVLTDITGDNVSEDGITPWTWSLDA